MLEYEAAAIDENNKKVICVNVDGAPIITDAEVTCKTPMVVKEAANFTAPTVIMCHPGQIRNSYAPILDCHFFIFTTYLSPISLPPFIHQYPLNLLPHYLLSLIPSLPHPIPFPPIYFLSQHDTVTHACMTILHSSHTHFLHLSHPLQQLVSPPYPYFHFSIPKTTSLIFLHHPFHLY